MADYSLEATPPAQAARNKPTRIHIANMPARDHPPQSQTNANLGKKVAGSASRRPNSQSRVKKEKKIKKPKTSHAAGTALSLPPALKAALKHPSPQEQITLQTEVVNSTTGEGPA